MNYAFNAAAVGLSVLSVSLLGSSAQAMNLVSNGDFSTNSTGGGSAYLGSQQTTIQDWDLTQIGYSFLIPDGAAAYTDINAAGNGPDPNGFPLSAPSGAAVNFWGSGTVDSPGGDWYLASDGAYGTAAPNPTISQTLMGLTPGQDYTVSFYQASAQQREFTGDVTAGWTVGFGGSSQAATTMNHASTDPVSAWEQQSLTFNASGSSQLLSFLATGSPVGQPPFSLLSGISVEPTTTTPPATAVPTPALLPGLLGFGMTLLRKRKAQAA